MKDLIPKYLTNSITDLELDKLREWLTKPKNQRIFNAYIKDDYNLNGLREVDDIEKVLERVWLNVQNEDTKVIPLFRRAIFKYAAVASVLLIVALTVFLNKGENTSQFAEPIIVNNQIKTGTDKAILTLENGEKVTLIKGTSFQSSNATSNGEDIIYKSSNTSRPEIAYNDLTIPRGGQYHIKLSDGTEVWLNSESQLKYPVSFIDGETRQVELVYGEAYFDVSPSANHKDSKFKVFNKSQEIEVLGTQFNIKAYKDENKIYTTLVEGKVVVSNNAANYAHLIPNQQSIISRLDSNTILVNDVDVFNEIAWKNGIFSFKNMRLKDIVTVLSRWYNIDIILENKELENELFGGILYKDQNIADILNMIKNTNDVSFEIQSDKIIMK